MALKNYLFLKTHSVLFIGLQSDSWQTPNVDHALPAEKFKVTALIIYHFRLPSNQKFKYFKDSLFLYVQKP